jgi:transposase-like protein
MDKEDLQVFNKELKNIKENSLDYEDGLEKLDDLCGRFKSKYPNFIKHIQFNKERYLCFLKYPESLRKHIYTTNPVESVNSTIEKVRINLGGYFQSVNILEINLLIQRDNLKNRKWKNLYLLLKELLMKFYNCLIKGFQSRHRIINKSLNFPSFY